VSHWLYFSSGYLPSNPLPDGRLSSLFFPAEPYGFIAEKEKRGVTETALEQAVFLYPLNFLFIRIFARSA